MDEEKGLTQIYCGPGKGKTSVAIGQAIRAVGYGKRAIVIQFLKGRATSRLDYLNAMENNMAFDISNMTEEEKKEENLNIRNGLNFARKVLLTEECDMLILDEILGALEFGIVSEEEIESLIQAKDYETELIMTGNVVTEALKNAADRVVSLEVIK